MAVENLTLMQSGIDEDAPSHPEEDFSRDAPTGDDPLLPKI